MLLLLAPLGPPVTLCNQMTALVVLVLRFIKVRLRVALDGGQIVFNVELLLPSMVTQSAPLRTMSAVAAVPDIVGETPTAGFIVKVLVELAAAFELIVIGNVSAAYKASVRLKTTGPRIHPVLYAATASVSVVKFPPTPTVYVPLNEDNTVMLFGATGAVVTVFTSVATAPPGLEPIFPAASCAIT